MFLPDVNFWVALNFSQHGHHAKALAWFQGLAEGEMCYFCRLTQVGFLRLATNPKANPLQTRTMTQAWSVYDGALLDPRIGFANEPQGLESAWRGQSQSGLYSHHVWVDAYLAGFAIAGSYEVVTFDRGYAKFQGLGVTILK